MRLQHCPAAGGGGGWAPPEHAAVHAATQSRCWFDARALVMQEMPASVLQTLAMWHLFIDSKRSSMNAPPGQLFSLGETCSS